MNSEKRFCMQCMRELAENEVSCSHCGYSGNLTQQEPYLPMGTVLEERYICGKMIKKNIDSAVYIGHDLKEDKTIEIREFLPDKIALRSQGESKSVAHRDYEDTYADYLQSYTQLWRNLMRFKGLPALFNVNDVFSANNTSYAVTDHNDSTTFRKILNNMDLENNPMTLKRVKELIVPMLSTIESLHTANVVHRGISPDTLILSSDGSLKITGFAIPQIRTTKNELMCSVCDGYAAIEQYGFSWQQGAWTDIYSIGALIYELLTGRLVKKAPERLNDDEILFTDTEKQRIPESVVKLIRNCLAVMPQDRIKSIAEIRNVFVPFDAPISNVTRSATPTRDINSTVRVRTDARRIPKEEEPVKIYTKPKQAAPQTKTSQPKVIVISEDEKIKQRLDEEKKRAELKKRAEIAQEQRAQELQEIARQKEQRIQQLQEIERQKQEKRDQLKEKIKNTPVGAAAYKAKEKLKRHSVIFKNPISLGILVAVGVVTCCVLLTLLLYGTVLYRYVDVPVLDNYLASFTFLPVNAQDGDDLKLYEVPDFSGLTKEVIENEAAFSRKFNIVFEYDYCDTVASGYVFSQNISPGEQAEKGSVITVYISKGIQMITMIDVTDMTGEEAKEKLTEIGFNVITETVKNNGFRKEGKIVSVSLTAGNTYPKGSDVVIEVWGAPIWETLPNVEESTTNSTENTTSGDNNNNENPFGIPSIFDWLFGGIFG